MACWGSFEELGHFYFKRCQVWVVVIGPLLRKGNLPGPIIDVQSSQPEMFYLEWIYNSVNIVFSAHNSSTLPIASIPFCHIPLNTRQFSCIDDYSVVLPLILCYCHALSLSLTYERTFCIYPFLLTDMKI